MHLFTRAHFIWLCYCILRDSCVDLIPFLYQKGFPCSSGRSNLHSTSRAADARWLHIKANIKSLQVTHSPLKYGKWNNSSWADSYPLLSKHDLSPTPSNSESTSRSNLVNLMLIGAQIVFNNSFFFSQIKLFIFPFCSLLLSKHIFYILPVIK